MFQPQLPIKVELKNEPPYFAGVGEVRTLAVTPESQPDDPDAPKVEDEIWVCADGRHIPVSQLDPDHMRNILNMILKQRREKRAMRRHVKAVLALLGDDIDEMMHEDRKWGTG